MERVGDDLTERDQPALRCANVSVVLRLIERLAPVSRRKPTTRLRQQAGRLSHQHHGNRHHRDSSGGRLATGQYCS